MRALTLLPLVLLVAAGPAPVPRPPSPAADARALLQRIRAVPAISAPFSRGACATGDAMPVLRTESTGPLPTASPPRESLARIPNACPVAVSPAAVRLAPASITPTPR